MKDLIGIRVKMFVDGTKIEGVVVGDRPDRVLVQVTEGKPAVRVPKSKISFFVPDKEPEEQKPLLVLHCSLGEKCPGVFFVYRGDKLTKKSFDVFMTACPKRNEACHCSSLGDIRTVPQNQLSQVIGGLLIGEFPDTEEKKDGRKSE